MSGAGELDGESSRRLDPGQRRRSHRSRAQRYLLRRRREWLRIVTLFTPYLLLIIGIVAAGLGIAIWALRQSRQTLRETGGVFWRNLRVFAAIGGILLPATLIVSAFQYLLATNADFAALTGLSEDSPELQSMLGAVSLLT